MKVMNNILFSVLLLCLLAFIGCKKNTVDNVENNDNKIVVEHENNVALEEQNINDESNSSMIDTGEVKDQQVNSGDNVNMNDKKLDTDYENINNNSLVEDIHTTEEPHENSAEVNSESTKMYAPGEQILESDNATFASNSPSAEDNVINTMGIAGTSGEMIMSSISTYVQVSKPQEAPDGTKIWSVSDGNYVVDVQSDCDGNVYNASFLGKGEDAIEYLADCASAFDASAGNWVLKQNIEEKFENNGVTFSLGDRGNGEYVLRVVSKKYANTLESPY